MEILTLREYSIYLGPVAGALQTFFQNRKYSRLLILVDENTEQHCLPLLVACLPNWPQTIIRIPAGETFKNIDTCQLIWHQMLKAETDRRALLLNLGGGVIGDMGGFCAATFKRGIDFVQIPTTLLSQVDASIGGKLGIDFGMVKNSIGVFANPQAVFIDPSFLHTLSPRERRSGMAEIIKHALIADADQWVQLQHLSTLETADWPALIGPSLRIKQHIVEIDPFERGLRKALNFGHTIGHAVESLALNSPDPLLHGEAIAAGMVCETFLSHRLLGLPEAELARISQYLIRHYGGRRLASVDFPQLLELMANDKKNEDRRINFSLIPSAGEVKTDCSAKPAEIIESLQYYNDLV